MRSDLISADRSAGPAQGLVTLMRVRQVGLAGVFQPAALMGLALRRFDPDQRRAVLSHSPGPLAVSAKPSRRAYAPDVEACGSRALTGRPVRTAAGCLAHTPARSCLGLHRPRGLCAPRARLRRPLSASGLPRPWSPMNVDAACRFDHAGPLPDSFEFGTPSAVLAPVQAGAFASSIRPGYVFTRKACGRYRPWSLPFGRM